MIDFIQSCFIQVYTLFKTKIKKKKNYNAFWKSLGDDEVLSSGFE